jgi:hypothetical protein
MDTVPKNVKAGCALGLIGGTISVMCLVIFFETDVDTLSVMGIYMLFAVLFFALAGALTKNNQWSWDVLTLMTFLTIGIIAASVIYELVEPLYGLVLIVIGALIVVTLAFPSSKVWLNRYKF